MSLWLLSWLLFRGSGKRRGNRMLRKVILDMDIGATINSAGLISAQIRGPNHCAVTFYAECDGKFLVVWTALQINIKWESCTAYMLRLLLRRNVEQAFGRIGLQEGSIGGRIVMTECLEHAFLRPAKLRVILDALIEQSRNLAHQLYAEGLVKRVSDWEDDPYAWS